MTVDTYQLITVKVYLKYIVDQAGGIDIVLNNIIYGKKQPLYLQFYR